MVLIARVRSMWFEQQARLAAAGGALQCGSRWRRPGSHRAAASVVPRAGSRAVGAATAVDGDWSHEDDDDYQLLDPLDLSEVIVQLAGQVLLTSRPC